MLTWWTEGFLIEEECEQKSVDVIRPSFIDPNEKQLSVQETDCSRSMASARVHVERFIERFKNFKIPHDEVVICGVVNLSSAILAESKFQVYSFLSQGFLNGISTVLVSTVFQSSVLHT